MKHSEEREMRVYKMVPVVGALMRLSQKSNFLAIEPEVYYKGIKRFNRGFHE
jgi:hypothetical protein